MSDMIQDRTYDISPRGRIAVDRVIRGLASGGRIVGMETLELSRECRLSRWLHAEQYASHMGFKIGEETGIVCSIGGGCSKLAFPKPLDGNSMLIHGIKHLSTAPKINPFGTPLYIALLEQLAADDDDCRNAHDQARPEQIATDVEMERLAGPIWIFQHDLEHGGVECTPADQTCPALPALQDGRIGQRSKSVGHAALQVRSNRNQSASEGQSRCRAAAERDCSIAPRWLARC